MPYRTAAPPDAPIPRCPRCVRDLAAHTEMWIERHVCPECRGHFIRRDELARVALVIGVPVDELEGRGAPALPELGCPLCGGIMQRFVIGPLHGIHPSNTLFMIAVPRVDVIITLRMPSKPRVGIMYSIRTREPSCF